MSGERVERRLAAILAVDVAGYSRLMGEDEEGTGREYTEATTLSQRPSIDGRQICQGNGSNEISRLSSR